MWPGGGAGAGKPVEGREPLVEPELPQIIKGKRGPRTWEGQMHGDFPGLPAGGQ